MDLFGMGVLVGRVESPSGLLPLTYRKRGSKSSAPPSASRWWSYAASHVPPHRMRGACRATRCCSGSPGHEQTQAWNRASVFRKRSSSYLQVRGQPEALELLS